MWSTPPRTRPPLPRSPKCAAGWRWSKSGFYEWRGRPASLTARRRADLKVKIAALFEANHGTYGYRRVHAVLVRGGEQVGPELVRRLMRELGLVVPTGLSARGHG